MPKYAICSLIVVASLAMTSLTQADEPIQTLTVTQSPTKLDKKKLSSIELGFDIKTRANDGAALKQDEPPNASKTVVDFAKNIVVDTSAYPPCAGDPAALEGTTTEQAIAICGEKSIISVPSKSSAHVTVDLNPALPDPAQTFPLDVVLTAFNGAKPNTLIFHNRVEQGVNTTTVLNEKLKPSKDKKYGSQLITNIPPVTAGGVDDFHVTIKKRSVAFARCNSTTNPFRITSTFPDLSPPKVTSTTKTTCTRKG